MGASEDINRRIGPPFHSARRSQESFIVLQILKGLRCSQIGASSFYSCHFAASECLEDDTC